MHQKKEQLLQADGGEIGGRDMHYYGLVLTVFQGVILSWPVIPLLEALISLLEHQGTMPVNLTQTI